MNFFLCLQFPRSNAKSHSQTHIESHLNLALRGLEATQHQVHELVAVVKDQSQHIERQSGQIERLMSKDKEQLEKMERLMSRVEDQSQQIERLISKDKEQSDKMERSISTVQSHPPQREGRGPIKQILPTPFEWEIHIIRGQNQFSKPFYLFEGGYKYLLQIKPVVTRLQFVVRVYIKLVPGEFDELLSWPCKEKVRVAWVNQDNLYGEYKSDVIDFEKGTGPCNRPLNDNYHEYRFVLDFKAFNGAIILITVNRE